METSHPTRKQPVISLTSPYSLIQVAKRSSLVQQTEACFMTQDTQNRIWALTSSSQLRR